jgi:hypothetical protein
MATVEMTTTAVETKIGRVHSSGIHWAECQQKQANALNDEIQAVLFFTYFSAFIPGTKLDGGIGGNGCVGLVLQD